MTTVTTPRSVGFGGPPTDMRHFTLLIFDDADEVIDTKTLRSANLAAARKVADKIMAAYPRAAGYQIWRKGARVHTTYPLPQTEVAGPIAYIAMSRNGSRKLRRS